MTHPDPRGNGDGWVECAQQHRHWGRFGAAGLLLHRPAADGRSSEVLLQHRAVWSHHGGTWGLLGGARHSDESAVEAALREAAEEGGLDPAAVRVEGRFDDPHGGWSYVTVLATTSRATAARPTSGESIEVAWVPVDLVAAQPLHPGFAAGWPLLRRALHPLTIVVDAANVVGSRPDGWWRDRAGAARSLLRGCDRLAAQGLAAPDLPEVPDLVPLTRRWPRWVVVLEGQARAAADDAPGNVTVRTASGEGDDEVVSAVEEAGGEVVVVTADRGLAERASELGASVVGPGWFLSLQG